MKYDFEKFKGLIEDQHEFPCPYTFKLITPLDKEDQVMNYIGDRPLIRKPSRNGNFVSLTYTTTVNSSDEIIDFYKELGKIPGVMLF